MLLGINLPSLNLQSRAVHLERRHTNTKRMSLVDVIQNDTATLSARSSQTIKMQKSSVTHVKHTKYKLFNTALHSS